MTQRSIWHNRIYLLSLFGVAVGLPLNKLVLSLSGMLMALNWLIEGNFREKFASLKKEKTGVLLAVVYFILCLSLLYSEDIAYGFKDLRIKLPMLLFPVVMLSSKPLTKKMYQAVMLAFVLAVCAVTLINYLILLSRTELLMDAREMSIFDSHIRLSLMVTIGIFLSIKGILVWKGWARIAAITVMFWLLFYTHKSEVLTGYFSVIITGLVIMIRYIFKTSKVPKSIIGAITTVSLIGLFYIFYLAVYPIPKEDLNKNNLPEKTVLGHLYDHNMDSKITENGYYIHYYVCAVELDSMWQLKTGQSLLSNSDAQLYPTLLRYMTSLGLRKDAQGFQSLTDEDIQNIRNGYPSIVYAKGGLNARLARITMEVQRHLEGADPNGSTIQQRVEYWSKGSKIISANFLLGVGVGDVQAAFNQAYESHNSKLKPENRLHTHQQFMTLWISAGLPVILVFLFYIFSTLLIAIRLNSYTLLTIWTIITCSYFFEDTLETQVGVTLAAFLITFTLKQEKSNSLY